MFVTIICDWSIITRFFSEQCSTERKILLAVLPDKTYGLSSFIDSYRDTSLKHSINKAQSDKEKLIAVNVKYAPEIIPLNI